MRIRSLKILWTPCQEREFSNHCWKRWKRRLKIEVNKIVEEAKKYILDHLALAQLDDEELENQIEGIVSRMLEDQPVSVAERVDITDRIFRSLPPSCTCICSSPCHPIPRTPCPTFPSTEFLFLLRRVPDQ